MSEVVRIAWFSPLVDRGSKGAYATRVLLPHLTPHCEIDLFHDSLTHYEGREVYPFLSAIERHACKPYDLFLYHLEDSKESYFSRIHLALHPGVVWFHDFFLSDYGPEPILNSAWQETVAKFKDRARAWCTHDMKHSPKGPQAFREAALAAVKIFSSERDHNEYRRSVAQSIVSPQARSFYLPLPVEIGSAREEPLISSRQIAFCGAPRVETRAYQVLSAVKAAGYGTTLAWLVDEQERSEAEALIADVEIEGVRLLPGRTPEIWAALVKESVLGVHTRFSVFGQLGPYLNVSLAAGIPTVVCNFGQGELLPDSVTYKISCGAEGERELTHLFRRVLSGEVQSKEISHRVREYGAEMFDARVIAQEFMAVTQTVKPAIASVSGRWREFEGEARRQLCTEARELLDDTILGKSALQEAYVDLGWDAL